MRTSLRPADLSQTGPHSPRSPLRRTFKVVTERTNQWRADPALMPPVSLLSESMTSEQRLEGQCEGVPPHRWVGRCRPHEAGMGTRPRSVGPEAREGGGGIRAIDSVWDPASAQNPLVTAWRGSAAVCSIPRPLTGMKYTIPYLESPLPSAHPVNSMPSPSTHLIGYVGAYTLAIRAGATAGARMPSPCLHSHL